MSKDLNSFCLTLKLRYFTISLHCLPREGANSIGHLITGQRRSSKESKRKERDAGRQLGRYHQFLLYVSDYPSWMVKNTQRGSFNSHTFYLMFFKYNIYTDMGANKFGCLFLASRSSECALWSYARGKAYPCLSREVMNLSVQRAGSYITSARSLTS